MVDWDKKAKKIESRLWDIIPHEKRQNKIVDRKLGGELTPASGAKSGAKGDRELDGVFKIEQKATDANSISINLKWLDKIYREARQQNKEPALLFSFLQNKAPIPSDWVAIPLDLFKEIYEFLKENGYEF